MKDWIKKLSDRDIEDALNKISLEKPIPEELDSKELYKFQHYEERPARKKGTAPVKLIFAFAGIASLALILIVLVPRLLRVTGQGTEYPQSQVVFLNDDAMLERDNVQHELSLKYEIGQGDRIETGSDSSLDIQIGEDSVIGLEEKSECILSWITKRETFIDLGKGRIIACVEHLSGNSRFKIITCGITVTDKGTQFMVDRAADGKTFVYVYRGVVTVDYTMQGTRKQETVNGGEFIALALDTATKEKLPDSIITVFRRHEWRRVKNYGLSAEINLSLKPEIATVTIDRSDTFTIKADADFYIEAGKHVLEFDKPGYKSLTLSVDLREGERYSRIITLEKENSVNKKENETGKDALGVNPVLPLKRWTWKRVYAYKNPDNSAYNNILGFASGEDAVVAYTQTSLVRIDGRGDVSWEKKYGKNAQLIFNSLPYVFDGKVYVSASNKQILVFDEKTGIDLQLRKIDAKGSINFNYSMVEYGNVLYIPYADGIYTLDTVSGSLSPSPVIPYNSPTIPIINADRVYVSSYLLKQIDCFDKNDKQLWNFLLDARGYSSPVLIGDRVFLGDRNGSMYVLSALGSMQKKEKLPAGITARIAGTGSGIVCLCDNGILYKLRPDDLSIEASFPIDAKADVPSYIYKYPLLRERNVFIGTDKGTVMIIDLTLDKVGESLAVSDSAISCAIGPLGDSYVAGTKSGDVFLIEYR